MAGKPNGPSKGVKLRRMGRIYQAFEGGVRKAMKEVSPEERARLPSVEEFLKGMKRSTSVARGLYNNRIAKESIREMAGRMRVRPEVLKKLEGPTIELLWFQSQRTRAANPNSPAAKAFAETIEYVIPKIMAEMEGVLGSGQRLTAYLNIIREQAEPLGKGYLKWPAQK